MSLARSRRRTLRRERSERGSHVVEFALVFCFVILPLILGIIQYGYQYWALQTADAAAREAARSMSVGTDWNCVQSAALSRIDDPAINGPTNPSVTMSYSDPTPKVGTIVSVRVQFSSLHIGFIPLPADGQIDRTAQAKVENVPAAALPC